MMNIDAFVKMNDKNLIQSGSEDVCKSEELNKQVFQIEQVSSKTLFGEAKEIVITHLGESYMLTITKQKKLLLTKVKHHLVR
jgi:hemin uptake protein HemP